ncbi:YdiY family protein [Erythrobacter sp. HKB08]|uniref:DUF481 domain-containing protein n=1 Tax=Erythrobacter sp. HKB08 TaxID=2502843 RepID=UPI001008A428|nr:DUF481 domain-containing protein [Erythrobacter sp. HKB08]
MKKTALTLAIAAAAIPATAHASLPDPVRAMIDAAIATGDKDKVATVIELARQTNPDDAAELDAIADAFAADQAELAAAQAAAKEEAIRESGLFDNWRGEGQLGAFRSTGNSSNTGLTAGLELERVGIDWRHKVTALADYQRSNGVTTREQFLFAYEPNIRIDDRLFAYGLAQYERDRFQGFTSRYSVSGGLGWRAIREEDMTLSLKAGPAWRKTERVDGSSTSRIAGLAALDFDWRLSDTIKLTEDANAFVQSDNSTFTSTTGIVAALGGDFSAKVSYTVELDTNPPPGAVKTDTLTRITLVYDF